MQKDFQILGMGIYSPREAARLVGLKPQDVRRWTRGSGPTLPLWNAYFQELDDSSEISFLDLIEVRVVSSLRRNGISLQAIRFAIEYAQEEFKIDRPLATLSFKTDGKEILINAVENDGELTSLNFKRAGQKVFSKIIQQSLVDLEFENARPVRWKPKNAKSVVIDPERAFGAPILDEFGISTRVIYDEYQNFNDLSYLSKIYEVPKKIIQSAISFERSLDGQSPV